MNGYAYTHGKASPPSYQGESSPSHSDSDSDDSLRAQSATLARRYGGQVLRPKHVLISKLHSARKYFDSGEYFSAKAGVVLQDLLPGGAPVDACPVKLEPTIAPMRGRSHLDTVNFEPVGRRTFNTQFSVCDY